MTRRAPLFGRSEIPLTLVVLDEVQHYIRPEPHLTLQVQTIAGRFVEQIELARFEVPRQPPRPRHRMP
jgi:hypothetical protein